MRTSKTHSTISKPRALLLIVALAYAIAVFIEVIPSKRVPGFLVRWSEALIHPHFEQRWTLFAPNLNTFHLETQLHVRYRQNSKTLQRGPLSLTVTLNEARAKKPLTASRLHRAARYFDIEAANLGLYEARVASAQRRHPDQPLPDVLLDDLERKTEAFREHYAPFLSAVAASTAHPQEGSEILEVRAVVLRRAIPQPASRIPEPPIPVFDSGWLPFVSNVASLGPNSTERSGAAPMHDRGFR